MLGDCLQILAGREVAIPADLTSFFQKCVFQAIEQEIAVKDRHTLAVAPGPAWRSSDRGGSAIGKPTPTSILVTSRSRQASTAWAIKKRAISIAEPFWLSKYPVTNSQYALFIHDGGYSRQEFWSDEAGDGSLRRG